MLWALHGFWGSPSNWEVLADEMAAVGLPRMRSVPHLTGGEHISEMPEWGKRFAQRVHCEDSEPLIMGYSLGARLALHALLADPALWRGAIIVSSRLGILDEAQRLERIAADEAWARKFLHEDWEQLQRDWDGQMLFGGKAGDLHPHDDSQRTMLAEQLRCWSPAQVRIDGSELTKIPCPVLWIVGEHDTAALRDAKRAVPFLVHGTLKIFSDAHHRVPWEKTGEFCKTVGEWFHHLGAHHVAFDQKL